MQKDSVHISTSGTLTHLQAATQEPQLKSLQCSHCSLVFNSKVYLFEHLNKVHDFSVDAALTDASLKQAGTDQTETDIKGNNSGEYFECQRCGFKAFSLDVLKEHEKRCQRKSENQNLSQVISENQKCQVVLKNHTDAEGAQEIPSLNPVKSTATTKCTPNSSKDLKTYKRPLQTITKYLVASSGIKRESPVQSDDCSMSLDGSKETLLLQESPSNSSPNSSGVFKVTAMPTIDITERDSTRFLLDDPFPGANLKPPKLQGQLKKTVLNYVDKRPKNGSSGGPPVKKAKSDKNLPEKANASKHQSSSNKELSLEFSEGEEERNLEDMDVETSTVYNCKRCDFCAVGIRPLSTHYQNSHPHIRYNAVYLKDPTDQSATFRCLECPIEFSNEAELKRHCTENHPEALRALTMQSHGHSLVFKCFVCSFTTDALKALKEHYREKHPTQEVDNSLMYCRYSASRYQEEDESRLVECEKVPSPERTEDISAESVHVPCNKVRKTPSPQHPNSIEADMSLYHCNNCKFSHKSLIVMHVHYQRSHPDEAVTIDTIKQSASVSSHTKLQMTSGKSPDSVMEKSTPTKSNTDSETPKHKNKLSLKRFKLCLRKPMRTQEASKTHSESPKSTKVESAEDRSKGTVSPTTQDTERSYDLDSLSVGNSPEKLFYCQRCCYSSTNIKSVLGHHNTKHSGSERTDIIEIALYSTEMQKRKQIQLSPSSIPADSEVCEQVEVCGGTEHQHMEGNSTKISVVESNAYAHPDNLFYCQKCNLGNPTIKGVLNHQNKAHRNIKTKRECIIKHTALVRDQIQKSKSQENGSAYRLPLPVLNEGETDVFFCHFCNYRHRFLKEVLRHYATRHPRFKVKDERIRRYSSLIHEKIQKSPRKSPENQEVAHESLGAKEEKKIKTTEGSKVSESPSTTASQILRTLKCRACQYKTQHVYLLRRHLKQIHKASRTVTEILRMCYKQGAIPAGYHCDMCVFSHQTAKAIYEHYKDKHKKQPSLEFVSTRLHVGPKSGLSKRKEQQIEGTDILIDGDVTDDSLAPQRSRPNENRVYSCKACSFKSHSMSNITQHYRAVHPWSVKEDGSVLDVIDSRKPGANRQVEDPSDIPVALDKYQVPLEFDNSPGTPNKVTKSSKKIINYCPAKFHTQLRLDTHIGLKHRESETETENSNEHGEEQMQIQTSFHLFSCPHCPYVNTIYHGALNHCQMKHPGAESSAGSFLVDGDDLKKLRDCLKRKGPGVRVSGYMCKTCPQIYATLEKVERHFRNFNHGNVAKAVPTKLKPPPKLSAVMKQTKAKLRSNKGFMSKAPFFKNKQLMIKCHHCAYKCTTKLGLGRHVLLSHSNESAAKADDPPYKCALCSNAYFRKKLLGTHYANKHGKESLVKYFVPLNKQVDMKPKPASADCSLTQHQQNDVKANKQRTTTEENKIWMFKCPYCTYVNASYFGILTHCQMSHPGSSARADDLQVEEILVTNMVGFSKGKSPNVRGYRCKRCPQIHVSMKKLKTHCESDHGTTETTSSKLVLTIKKTQKQQDYSFQHSVLEAFSLKNDTSAVSIIETDRSPQLDAPEIGDANTTSVQNKEMPYECHICSYKGSFRRYLQSHYRKCHKIDALTTHKLLQKYNKRTHKTEDQLEARPEETAAVECKMCPNVTFDSPELLIAHFRTAHNSDRILDFIILSRGSKRTTGLYKCLHCKKQLNGISKMCYHMDRHRERESMKSKDAKMETSDVVMTIPEDRAVEQGELPVVETLEELEWDGAPVEIMTLPTSPLSSPTKPTDQEQPEEDSRDDLPTCQQCGRTFMSVKGLRSHERSHAAFAAIKKHTLPASVPRHKINKYIIYKSGTTKPFVCSFCSYRTNVMGLWRRHFMKSHQDILEDPTDAEDQDEGGAQSDVEPNPSEEWSDIPTHDEKPETNKRSLYSEPPNVQQQLNQYNLMAQVGASSKVTMKVTRLSNSSVLYCELCNFNTEHLSSIRRHYSNRHGKKLHKCKDCEFFTCSRKTLKVHMDRGHSACPSEPTHQKDICCPFCLYQTKNKNHMIDHIILHREERLVPIEVRRPKLSRYLRGMVFRCHNCTFTCGNAENLHLHMMKHDDVKPYKCRLCFFDCTQLSDLEAHLSDKHQVIRNHELVGQVSLDQLEARGRRTPGDEEELSDDSKRHNKETIKTEEIGTDYDEVQQQMRAKNPGENEMMEIMTFKIEDDYQQQDMDGTKRNEEGPESLLSDLENTVDQNIGESMEFEDCKGPEKEMQTKENTARTSLRDCGGSSTRSTHENKQDESLWVNVAKNSQLHIEGLQKNVCITEDSVKNNTLDENLEIHMMVDPEREIKTEQEIMYAESTIGFANNQNSRFNTEANKSQRPETTARAQESFTFNNDLLPSVSNCAQFRISHQESLGVSLTQCNEKQMRERHNSEQLGDQYGEMPVLKKEYLREEMDHVGCYLAGDHNYYRKQEQDKEKMIREDDADQEHVERDGIKDADKPHVPKGALPVTDGAAEGGCPVTTEDKRFTCELCGRNLMNSFDLQRHVLRHGI